MLIAIYLKNDIQWVGCFAVTSIYMISLTYCFYYTNKIGMIKKVKNSK